MSETALLWLLGIFIGILLALIAVLYNTLIEAIKELKAIQKEKSAEMWVEINKLKDHVPKIDNHHQLLCQKHEDRMDTIQDINKRMDIAIHERLDVMESKLKSQGDFFNTRVQELIQTFKNKRL